MPHKLVSLGRPGQGVVYKAPMSASSPPADRPRSLARRLLPLAAIVMLAGAGYFAVGDGTVSLELLVRYRSTIDAFVAEHSFLAILAYIAVYVAAVALSLPGGAFLTVVGGFLFGIAVGASAAVIGATIGATLIFLVARTALGEPLLRRAGPRANQLAEGFRKDAFSYLLFLRLVPAFPFFLVNLVAAFAGVRLGPFVAATALGIIPGAVVFSSGGHRTGQCDRGAEKFVRAMHCCPKVRLPHGLRSYGRSDTATDCGSGCPRSPRTDADGGEVLARTLARCHVMSL